MCLKLWFENDWYFCHIIESGWSWKRLSRIKFQTVTSQFGNVTIQKSIVELWTVISDQMIKYQLIHTRFGQISDDKQDIYLYEKLLTELLVQAANKSFRCFPCPKSMFSIFSF